MHSGKIKRRNGELITIKLDKEYFITQTHYSMLRHNCEINWSHMDEGVCNLCKKVVPDKIWTMYKLWKINNG